MERDIIDSIREKEFIELTQVERQELEGMIDSEEEFYQLKYALGGINSLTWENPSPTPETKESLDQLFHQTHGKSSPVWLSGAMAIVIPKSKPFYRQPLIQFAAIGLLLLLVYPFLKNDFSNENQQIARVEDVLIENKTNVIDSKDAEVSKESESPLPLDVIEVTDIKPRKMDDESISDYTSMDLKEVNTPVLTRIKSETINVYNFTALETALPETATTISCSKHPDGVFTGEELVEYSLPASNAPDVLDLLTATF